jgi:hypothetical protein
MSNSARIVALRKGLRKARPPAPKPLTRAEIERIIDEHLERRLRELRLTPFKTKQQGCCG